MAKKLENGYYWVILHPIYEDDNWHISYYEDGNWYLHNLEGDSTNSVEFIGEKVIMPPKWLG